MSTSSVYRVTYHFEKSGKRCSETQQDNVTAAGSDYPTISAVLAANGKTNNGLGTLVIESVGHVAGVGGFLS
jgi:hypothetical protein